MNTEAPFTWPAGQVWKIRGFLGPETITMLPGVVWIIADDLWCDWEWVE